MQKLSKMAYSAILAILILPQKYLKLRRGHSCVRCITNIHVGLKKSREYSDKEVHWCSLCYSVAGQKCDNVKAMCLRPKCDCKAGDTVQRVYPCFSGF